MGEPRYGSHTRFVRLKFHQNSSVVLPVRASSHLFLERYEMRPGFVSRCVKGEPIRRAFDTLIDRGVRKSALAHPLRAAITRQLLLTCRDAATDSGR